MADTPTPNYGFILQQPGTNRSTWGSKLNSNWDSLDTILKGVSDAASSASVAAADALPKTGGTMTGPLIMAAPLLIQDAAANSPLSAGFRGVPVVNTDQSRTFQATDSGKMVRLSGAVSRNWTIPPVSAVPFPIGTAIVVRNFGNSGAVINLVRGAGVTLYADGSIINADRSVGVFGKVTLIMEDTNIWSASGTGLT